MATTRKRPEKINCKAGFVQRGAACQRPKPKKSTSLAGKIAGGLLTAGIVGAGATAIASRSKSTSNTPSKPEPTKQPAPKNKTKAFAVTGVAATSVLGVAAIAATNPRTREVIQQQTAFRQADAITLVAKAKGFRETPEEKAASDKIRQEIRTHYPPQTVDGNYAVDTDSDRVIQDADALFKKNRKELATVDNPRHRKKLLQQNALIRYNKAMHELSKSTHPHLVIAGFRDKEGNLVGTTAGVPDPKYDALYFGGFMVAEGSDRNAAIEFLKTNKQVSENMGFNGKLTGEPHETAKPLYQRYGGRPVPGDPTTWIFDGKKIKNEGWYKNHDSLKAVSDIVEINGYDEPANEMLRRQVDDLAKVPPHVLGALKDKGLKLIQIDNKPITQMDDLGDLKDVKPYGYPEGFTMENSVGGVYSFKNKVLVARGDLPSGSDSTILHETGHAIANLLGYEKDKRLDKLHKQVYADLPPYLQQGKPGSFLGKHELFAEGYATITKNPKLARRIMHPEVYKYFKNVVLPELDALDKTKTKKDSNNEEKENQPMIMAKQVKKAIALPNGNLMVPKRFYQDGELFGSGMIEVEPNSPEYKEWRGEAMVKIIRQDSTRFDRRMPTKSPVQKSGRPQRAGFTWVEDPRAKKGGYWRKVKNSATAGGLAAKLAAGAVAAGAVAAVGVANKQAISDVASKAQAKAMASLPDGGKKLTKETVAKVQAATQAAEKAIDAKIGKKKPSTSQRIAKEVAIELTSTITARTAGDVTSKALGNSLISKIPGLVIGKEVKKQVRSRLYDRYGEGLESEKGKKIVRGAVQLASMGVSVGIANNNLKKVMANKSEQDRQTEEFIKGMSDRSRSREAEEFAKQSAEEFDQYFKTQQGKTGSTQVPPKSREQQEREASDRQRKEIDEQLRKLKEEVASRQQSQRAYRPSSKLTGNKSSWSQTLGVKPDASPAEIKKAYREAARKYHPDVNNSPEAQAKMAEINEAYEKLKKRKDSFAWETIERAYREAWDAYPKMSISFWTENL